MKELIQPILRFSVRMKFRMKIEQWFSNHGKINFVIDLMDEVYQPKPH